MYEGKKTKNMFLTRALEKILADKEVSKDEMFPSPPGTQRAGAFVLHGTYYSFTSLITDYPGLSPHW
ncbi:hypothetical protein GOODEAATRI_013129 [Goodea atripinnis]|uniref:Uncharacterized protein n=1 Tax=Goodea atripinnis TaxID=208336 RepID=A0ABV0PN65_9TELE